MTVSPNQAFSQLAEENPAVVAPVPRLSAAEFVAQKTAEPVRLQTPSGRARSFNRGPLIGLATLIVLLIVGILISLATPDDGEVVDTVPTTITLPAPTTVEAVSPARQAAETLASAWSSGDLQGIQSLLAEGTNFGWSRISDFAAGPVLWTDAELRTRFDIDVALNTTIELTNCEDLDENRVSCAVLRTDDLVRAQQIEPVADVRWRLTVQDGLVVDWMELSPDLSDYFLRAREPFHEWLQTAHPEVEPPFVANRGAPWRADTDFAETAGDLVAEYAASLGVDLTRP